MKFIDEVEIFVQSGHGGAGAVTFRREKFVPRGGPDGGDGGRGGDVIFRVNGQLSSLLDLRYKRRHYAENGHPGENSMCTGRDGESAIVQVPPGTIIKDKETGEMVLELTEDKPEHVFLSGGRGGKGNAFFKTSVNQAPHYAQPGEPGQTKEIKLELKLLADVGIIGYPNAGKSTLISRISAARPKVADYPFTTLIPNLGVVSLGEQGSAVVADIPGLIPGAHEGAGLGTRFLKHIERTKCFIHLIDAGGFSGREAMQDYLDINHELEMYDREHPDDLLGEPLRKRPQIVVLNKIDSMEKKAVEELVQKFQRRKVSALTISAVSGHGIKDLLLDMGRLIGEQRQENS